MSIITKSHWTATKSWNDLRLLILACTHDDDLLAFKWTCKAFQETLKEQKNDSNE